MQIFCLIKFNLFHVTSQLVFDDVTGVTYVMTYVIRPSFYTLADLCGGA